MKPEPAFGWALSEPDSYGVQRIDIRSVRRTRALVIDYARSTVGISNAEKSWDFLKRRYRFKVVRVAVEAMNI